MLREWNVQTHIVPFPRCQLHFIPMPRSSSVTFHALCSQRIYLSRGVYIRDAAHRAKIRFPCPYCPYVALSEGGRAQHIAKTQECLAAELEQRQKPAKRVRFLTPTTNSEGSEVGSHNLALEDMSGSSNIQSAVQPMNELTAVAPDSLDPNQPPSNTPHLFSLRFAGKDRIFVERFPDARAGAPVSDKIACKPDLRTYLMKTGNLSNPDLFDTAELLMTTGLTNTGRDRHLQSRLVSSSSETDKIRYSQIISSTKARCRGVVTRSSWKISIGYRMGRGGRYTRSRSRNHPGVFTLHTFSRGILLKLSKNSWRTLHSRSICGMRRSAIGRQKIVKSGYMARHGAETGGGECR
jgi:hypothetical protein